MPKVKLMRDVRKEQAERNYNIIRAATGISPYKTLPNLAEAIGANYSAFYQSLRRGSIRAVDMASVIRTLELDSETVLALMGSPRKCRYEKGYVA